MFTFNQSKSVLIVSILFVLSLLSACNSNPSHVEDNNFYACTLPNSKQLTLAINQSQESLSYNQCQLSFNQHFETLLATAAGSPSDKNLERLAAFSRWAYQQGIISKKQSEETLRRYFSPQLVSLEYNDDYKTYSHCSMNQQLPQILAELDHELKQKQLGLAQALGDINSYREALKEYQSLSIILKSTGNACSS